MAGLLTLGELTLLVSDALRVRYTTTVHTLIPCSSSLSTVHVCRATGLREQGFGALSPALLKVVTERSTFTIDARVCRCDGMCSHHIRE